MKQPDRATVSGREGRAGLLLLTGGGTAGHVLPNIPIARLAHSRSWQVWYVGSKGIEEELAGRFGIRFSRIASGKLRRYFSWQNFFDLFKVALGVVQALILLGWQRPTLVFSKGGYVSVPVCIAAWLLRIPVFAHESDLTPGLATRIVAKFARKIFCAFERTVAAFPKGKAVYAGLPIRDEISQGSRGRALKLCGFEDEGLPVLLLLGGSQGSVKLNQLIEGAVEALRGRYRIVHVTGRGKRSGVVAEHYRQFEFLNEELADMLALADVVISRAGAGSIFELLSLQKPMLLIPLAEGSRGDQVVNAKYFTEKGWALTLPEAEADLDSLLLNLSALEARKIQMSAAQGTYSDMKPSEKIWQVVAEI